MFIGILIQFAINLVIVVLIRIYVCYDRFKYYYLYQGKQPPRFRLKYLWDGPQKNWTDPRDGCTSDWQATGHGVAAVSDVFGVDVEADNSDSSGGGSGHSGGFGNGSGHGGGGRSGGGGAGRR